MDYSLHVFGSISRFDLKLSWILKLVNQLIVCSFKSVFRFYLGLGFKQSEKFAKNVHFFLINRKLGPKDTQQW